MRRIELFLEAVLFQSRWILAPFYIGLVLSLILLFIHFLVQLIAFVFKIHIASESDVILGVLGLVDLVLVGNLVIIVIFSGYENFVSRFETLEHDRPEWMTKIDFGGLKQKLMSSIVAISAIQLLKAFMNIGSYEEKKLYWLAGIHLVFLASMLVVAIADRLAEKAKPAEEKPPSRRRAA
jgi:uncharacterized protein (TIGR00645 family)